MNTPEAGGISKIQALLNDGTFAECFQIISQPVFYDPVFGM